MTDAIQICVDRGLEIKQQIKLLEKELSLIEGTLELAARQGEQVDLVDGEREGKQFLATGSQYIVPVVLTADIIRASFGDGSDIHHQIGIAAEGKLSEFYKPVTVWKSIWKTGKSFREKAFEALGVKAPAFIASATTADKNGIPKSQIKVQWDRATEVGE